MAMASQDASGEEILGGGWGRSTKIPAGRVYDRSGGIRASSISSLLPHRTKFSYIDQQSSHFTKDVFC
jgi:hypothetical protein